MATNSVLAKLAVVISANNAEFARKLDATRKDLNVFTSGVTKLAGTLGAAFSVQQVASFALEVSKLAGEAQGVNAAFERLPNSTLLMKELKEATGGTVSELGLMKRAVQASNFDISLKALPRLLEFATLRAQQAGQSVDYLVDSIVTGIGRKSKLILDNLGISAVQLNEALGGASTAAASIGEVADAVGKIAEDNLKNMAGFSDNASTKLQKLAATWENVKVAIGSAANETGILGGAIDGLSASLNVLASKNLSFIEKLAGLGGFGTGVELANRLEQIRIQQKINAEQKKQAQIISEVDRAFKEFNGDIDAYGKAITTHVYKTELLAEFTKRLVNEQKEEVTTLESLQAKQKELNDMFAQTDANDKQKLLNISQQITAVNKQIAALEALKNIQSSGFSKIGFKVPEFGDANFTEADFLDQSIDISIKEEDIEMLNAGIDAILGLQYAYDGLQFAIDDASDSQEKFLDLTPLVNSALSGIGHALGAAISGTANFGDALLGVLGGVLVQLGEMLITAGLGVEAFKVSLRSLNGAVAIAAGVALVAIGAAISGSIRGLGANPTGGGGSAGRSSSFNSSIGSFSQRGVELRIGEPITFKIQGEDLVYVLNRQNQLDGRKR
jgi:hypothetical protein